MVSIMAWSKNRKDELSGHRRSLAALLLAWSVLAWAAYLEFSQVTLTLGEDGRIYLDAQIKYQLTPAVSEALENGVPLIFVTHVQMRATDAWIWDKDVAEYRLRSQLRYRPLSGLYAVRPLDAGDEQVFATREAALRFMGRIRDFALIERKRLDLNKEYEVTLEAYLDIEALPLPLRPRAYLSRDWHLSAEPWTWQIRP